MLQLSDKRKAADGHSRAFLGRYEQVQKWARHFCSDRPWQADDLVQESFIQFMAIKPDLDQLRSLDAFLYTIVRNLHRSLLHRHLRLRQVPLSILDFDSVEDGLKWVEQGHLERVIDDLVAICDFACRRKESAKSGSLLILRFFHGFTVRETAALMAISRGAVDERLRQARREAREHLSERQAKFAGKVVELAARVPDSPAPAFHVGIQDDVLELLRNRIFASQEGECLSKVQLQSIYARLANGGVDHPVLAHIVSCRSCLNDAARHLKLGPTSDGTPGHGAPGSPTARAASKTPESVSKAHRVRQWERQFERMLDHRPQELRVTVNGVALASQVVVAGRGDLSINVTLTERIQFVEVLSEQEVRLLMLLVEAIPPEGEFEQTGCLDFGDGRTLTIALTFDDPWPTVHVQYSEPEPASAIEWSPAPPMFGEYGHTETSLIPGWLSWIWRPASRLTPRFWTPALATVMIAALLFVQTHETTANAAELLNRMDAWQRSAAQPGAVLHRTFDLIERPKHAGHTSRHRVEVWRKPDSDTKVSRLMDESGAVLQSARSSGPPKALTVANAWQFEPAADSFRILMSDPGRARVKQSDGEIELDTEQVRLRIDRRTFKPSQEIIETPDAEFEFTETATETVPERLSPLSKLIEALPPKAAPIPAAPKPRADSLETELAVRYALHQADADLDEPIDIQIGTQGETSVTVVGIVPSIDRKQALLAVLRSIPHVAAQLRTEDEAAQAMATLPLPTTQAKTLVVPAHSPIEKELTDYLGDPVAAENFSKRAITLSKRLMARAWALRRLSDRYGAAGSPSEVALNLSSRQLLLSMRRDHYQAMSDAISELTTLMQPFLPSIVPANPASTPKVPVFEGAQRVQQLTEGLLSGSGLHGPNATVNPAQALQDLQTSLQGLQQTLEEQP